MSDQPQRDVRDRSDDRRVFGSRVAQSPAHRSAPAREASRRLRRRSHSRQPRAAAARRQRATSITTGISAIHRAPTWRRRSAATVLAPARRYGKWRPGARPGVDDANASRQRPRRADHAVRGALPQIEPREAGEKPNATRQTVMVTNIRWRRPQDGLSQRADDDDAQRRAARQSHIRTAGDTEHSMCAAPRRVRLGALSETVILGHGVCGRQCGHLGADAGSPARTVSSFC